MFRWPQECCLATCKLHDCSDGFVANSSYDSNTGVAVMNLAQSGVKSIQLRKHMLTYKIGMINISKSIFSLTSKQCKEMGMCQKLGINGPTSWTFLYLIALSDPFGEVPSFCRLPNMVQVQRWFASSIPARQAPATQSVAIRLAALRWRMAALCVARMRRCWGHVGITDWDR